MLSIGDSCRHLSHTLPGSVCCLCPHVQMLSAFWGSRMTAQNCVTQLLLPKKQPPPPPNTLFSWQKYFLLWKTFMPLLSFLFSVLYSYNEDQLIYLWNVSVAPTGPRLCFLLYALVAYKRKDDRISPCQSVLHCKCPFPIRQTLQLGMRRYLGLLIYGRNYGFPSV